MRRALLLATAAVLLASCPPALAVDPATGVDGFNRSSVNQLDVAGNEIPYTSAAPVILTAVYDSSAFTTSGDELGAGGQNRTGCGLPDGNFTFGGRTGWVRFLPGATGTLKVTMTTNYSAWVELYAGPKIGFSDQALTTNDLPASSLNCDTFAAVPGGRTSTVFNSVVAADQPIHVHTLGVCAADAPAIGPCTNPDPLSPGGMTTVTFTFTPSNPDGDAVPDPLDLCPAVPGTAADGCPDADGDGVSDRVDQCAAVAGVAPTGCPDRDADTVPDAVDSCPDVAGLAPDGCPPDVDGDGIANALDACPFQSGVAPAGCPLDRDPDHDGVPVEVDKCPAQAGTAADGCPDSDADGVSDRVDRCLKDKGDLPNGCPSQIAAKLPNLWRFVGRATRLAALTLRGPVGAHVVIRCSPRRGGCPFARKTIAHTKKRSTDLARLFARKRVFDPGTTITVSVTVPGHIGAYRKYTMAPRQLPRTAVRCIALSGKLTRCS